MTACRVDNIGKSIVAAAKEIIVAQQAGRARAGEAVRLEEKVNSRLGGLEDRIAGLETKIDLLIGKLTSNTESL